MAIVVKIGMMSLNRQNQINKLNAKITKLEKMLKKCKTDFPKIASISKTCVWRISNILLESVRHTLDLFSGCKKFIFTENCFRFRISKRIITVSVLSDDLALTKVILILSWKISKMFSSLIGDL